jgi:hypothetical protein
MKTGRIRSKFFSSISVFCVLFVLSITLSGCGDDSNEEITSSLTYPIVDTSQGLCYNNFYLIDCPAEGAAFYGQDAQYTGTEPSYTDNGDGTVTDNVTGMIWTQSVSTYAMAWNEAELYCEALETGDITDWRLPAVKELWSIRNFSQGWPWVDTDYFYLVGDGTDLGQHHSWTSNAYLVESDYQNSQVDGEPHWIVNDWTGHTKAMSGSRFVRCVSAEEGVYGVNDFVDNGDGTVSDNATGLMWSQDDNGEAINWEAALAYAENAEVAGYTDWRLPNAKELESLADYEKTDIPVMDTSMFNFTELTNYVYDEDTGLELIDTQVTYPFYWTGSSNPYVEAYNEEAGDDIADDYEYGYTYAWLMATGYCPDMNGWDLHGAGAVVFDTKSEDVSDGSGIEVFYHYVRLVRDGDVIETPDGDSTYVDEDRNVVFDEGITSTGEDSGGPDFTVGVDYLEGIGITVTSEVLTEIVAGPPAPTAEELVSNFSAYDASMVITAEQAQALLDTLGLEDEVVE